MNTPVTKSLIPNRILYTMLRVSDLDKSIAFYRDMLGMQELRRETFPEGKFTLVFMGYGDASTQPTVELTYNWGDNIYELGNGYGHIALEVDDIYQLETELQQRGVNILRPAAPMTFAPEETGDKEIIAFITDPDGYKVELIQA